MRNQIVENQNSAESIDYVAASSQLYGYGKIALAVQIGLTVGAPVVLTILALLYPGFKIWATSLGITITWLDVLVIDRIQIYFRKRGALIQEARDCALFGLEWNELRCGKPLEKEAVHSGADDFKKRNPDLSRFQDWYPVEVGTAPLPVARVICQRACLWWDTTQRRFYGLCLIGLMTAAIISVLLLAIWHNMAVSDMILSLYAPLAPAIIWCFREARRQLDAAGSLEKSRGAVEGVWKQLIAGKLAGAALENTARQIQDTLFENRNKNPLIFNWIYFKLRSSREKAMKSVAADMVREAQGIQPE